MSTVPQILDEFGRPFRREPGRRSIRSSYDSAATSDENRRHWNRADALSARAANNPGVRHKLRIRSRYERDNDPYYDGLIRTLAEDTFGTGPTLQVQTEDEELNSRVEAAFAQWANAVGFNEKCITGGQAKVCDGEMIGLMRRREVFARDTRLPEPVQLDIQLVETEQCATPTLGMPKDLTRWCDGIELDDQGEPAFYHILKQHPGDTYVAQAWEFERVPADQVLQWYCRKRPGQLRGVPEMQSGMPTGAMRRRWSMATLQASEYAADFAVLIETQFPPGSQFMPPQEWETMEIDRGMMMTLPPGGAPKQMKSEHPTAEYTPFKHEHLKEMGRPVGAPYSITGCDGSEHNYSSLKWERGIYEAAQTVTRDSGRQQVLDRVVAAWYREARLIPGYLAPTTDELPLALPHSWYWPSTMVSLDPMKEAAADTERLANCTTTLKELLAGYGQDWKTFLKQRARELEYMLELGLPLPAWADPAAKAAQAAPPADDATPDEPLPVNRINGHAGSVPHANGNGRHH